MRGGRSTQSDLAGRSADTMAARAPVPELPDPADLRHIPPGVARLQAMFFEMLPGAPIMSRDNLDSMQVDNVVDPAIQATTAAVLGITLTALEAVGPNYLLPTARFDDFRARAGR